MLYTNFMIGQLTGTVVHTGSSFILMQVGGIGFKVSVTNETLQKFVREKKEAALWTYLAVRENAMELYGFQDQDSLSFFELLLTVSGIGPKSALAILNIAPVKTLRSAIASGDATHLTKTTGIGTKKAEKIIVELKDKLDVLESDISAHRGESDVLDALKALGYSGKEARDALQKLPKDALTPEEKIKQALKTLGR